ncbi:putative electron transport protein YccM [bacterium BMS3Abin07]|nr:putative electron transport protein YccM [bacterium BMS3Abin07]GBE33394.1 putative electron transport protein YccM [bacterium BMS3Bbin05]HDO22616.1 4Fe-4S binding protein [Nitrospirota bacterium]
MRYIFAFLLLFVAAAVLAPAAVNACGGTDVVLSENPASLTTRMVPSTNGVFYDYQGNLLLPRSEARISPVQAEAIVTFFSRKNLPFLQKPFLFRKLEYVHEKLIYQFTSQESIPNYNGKYHLGPVNFIVDKLVLDVDAATGNIYVANGCGSAPGQLIYKYNRSDLSDINLNNKTVFISDNTNFIARRTGNKVIIDGRINDNEWKNTGHKYFYLGTYKRHLPSEPHTAPYYYAEVWTQIDDNNIYFAVKTDTPNWVGLMFKDDPNLGMLGSYVDAKVMKSNGDITDRFFTQRKDKTFFLQKDKIDNITAKGADQGDFYTYEFSFPLKTGDTHDIAFEKGRAYNMLFLAGNTLEHYGIFTLNKAHKNHDHSKNNREHADVWASTEEIIRIGTPAGNDIFGHAVKPVFTSYVSGFDPAKNNNHFHYAHNTAGNFSKRTLFAKFISWFSVIMSLSGAALIMVRFRRPPSGSSQEHNRQETDFLKVGWIRRFTEWKYFRALFIVPTLLVFMLIIFYGFFDVQDGRRNIATVYTWTIWWSLIIVSFILLGRVWCMMCPFAAIGDLAQKIVSFNRKLPRWLQNIGFQTLAFILLTLAFALFAFNNRPRVTAIVIGSILLSAIIVSVIYRRRSFCRHICPIGAIIGIYSTISPIELRACSKDKCTNHRDKTCITTCPMLESPNRMDSNIYCNFCMKCSTACPSSNLSLRLRTFGKDIYSGIRKSSMESAASLFLLGIVIVETLAMTSVWQPMEETLKGITGISSGSFTYSLLFSIIVSLPAVIFYLLCYLLKLITGKKYKTNDLATTFAFVFIPLGIALHLAHNMQHLFIEGPIAVPATIRLLQHLGIGTSLQINWNPSPLMGIESIFFLQMTILIAGLAFSIVFLYRTLRRFRRPLNHIYKTATVMIVYALVVSLTSIYMLGLPMNGRHIH